jgi:hypothetical protein
MPLTVAIWIALMLFFLTACGAADPEVTIQIEEKPIKFSREQNG